MKKLFSEEIILSRTSIWPISRGINFPEFPKIYIFFVEKRQIRETPRKVALHGCF